MAYGRRKFTRRKKTYSRSRYSRRGLRRYHKRRNRYGRRRSGRRSRVRPEWKRKTTVNLGNTTTTLSRDISPGENWNQMYYYAGGPVYPDIGPDFDERIGRKIGPVHYSLRLSLGASLESALNPAEAHYILQNYSVAFRIVVYQLISGDGSNDPNAAAGGLLYHPYNLTVPTNAWTQLNGAQTAQWFESPSNPSTITFPNVTIVRWNMGINKQMRIRHDKVYIFNSGGRMLMTKRWKFKFSHLQWTQTSTNGSQAYPTNAIRWCIFAQLQTPHFGGQDATLPQFNISLDRNESLKYQDA